MMDAQQTNSFRSGFVGIVGPPNSGKSTLLNALVGKKVSIVSPKPQTTLRVVRGIVSGKNSQLIFTDTPGIQGNRSRHLWSNTLDKLAFSHAQDCDLLLFVFDVTQKGVLHTCERFGKRLTEKSRPTLALCILNKVDLIPKLKLLPMIDQIYQLNLYDAIIPISAQQHDGVDRIRKLLVPKLPEGPQYYPTEAFTDRSEAFRVEEMVREKIYHLTYQELPYSIRVEVERWEKDHKTPTLFVVIHVDSDSRKGILIGKGGLKLKEIGTAARQEIETILGYRICLKLHVQVESDWRKDRQKVQHYLELE